MLFIIFPIKDKQIFTSKVMLHTFIIIMWCNRSRLTTYLLHHKLLHFYLLMKPVLRILLFFMLSISSLYLPLSTVKVKLSISSLLNLIFFLLTFYKNLYLQNISALHTNTFINYLSQLIDYIYDCVYLHSAVNAAK